MSASAPDEEGVSVRNEGGLGRVRLGGDLVMPYDMANGWETFQPGLHYMPFARLTFQERRGMETRNPANLAAPKRRGAQPDQPASYSTRTTYLFLSYLCNSHFAACG